jgi:hypothetical protein
MIALTESTENRFYPRITLNKPVTIRLPNGEIAHNNVHDISKIGLQMRCNRSLALHIHPQQTVVNEANSPLIRLVIQFPYPKNLPEIEVDCRLRHLNLIGPDDIALGFMFENFLEKGEQNFEHFIQQCLMPIGPALL